MTQIISNLYKIRYFMIIPYIFLVIVGVMLKSTNLNACTPREGMDVCLGGIDFFLMLLSLPGWLIWFAIGLLPLSLKLGFLKSMLGFLNVVSIEFNKIFIPTSFISTGIILYIAGYIYEKIHLSAKEALLEDQSY